MIEKNILYIHSESSPAYDYAGMANDPVIKSRLKRSGMEQLTPEAGMHVLGFILTRATPIPSTIVAAPILWNVVLQAKPAPDIFAEFVIERPSMPKTSSVDAWVTL